MNKFSERLLELRKEKKLSQLELSKELKYSREAICAWENGTREPSFDTLIIIANYFCVSTDFMLGLEDY